MTIGRRAFRAALERDPLRSVVPLPHQDAVLRDPSRVRLLRTGNQLGKTTMGVIDMLCTAIGDHPWNRAAELDHADEFWVLCATWAQSINIQRKIWALTPKDLVHPKTTFNEIRGFGWMNPVFQVRHRSGEYSTVRIKTTQQGALALAGASIPYAWFDEPPATDRVYAEVANRVRKYGDRGRVLITMTPVNAPIEWVRELTETEAIRDHWFRLEPEMMCPMVREGSWSEARYRPGTEPLRLEDDSPCDAAWIDKIIGQSLPHEVPVVVHGEWEFRSSGAYFKDAFREHVHVHKNLPEGEVRLCLGIDHGHRPGKQIAHLVAVQPQEDGEPILYVVDSYCDTVGTATPADDAKGILAMLERHGQRWLDLESAWGDRVHMSGRGQQKSNLDLMGQLARLLKVEQGKIRPEIRTVKQGVGQNQGSVGIGLRWLFHGFTQNRIGIHPRCTQLIEALHRYTRATVDDYADPIDGLRYALHPYIFRGRTGPAVTVRFR